MADEPSMKNPHLKIALAFRLRDLIDRYLVALPGTTGARRATILQALSNAAAALSGLCEEALR